jgi:hypothetical protein
MTRRFELGPLLAAAAAILLLVSLFLHWYGRVSAWDAFEVVDVALAALAVGTLLAAIGMLVPELGLLDRRWLPWLVGAVVVLVAAEILDPPPTAAGRNAHDGAWLAFGAACLMLVGAVLSLGRVSLAVAIEGRDLRRRVAAVDHRPPPTETGSMPVVPAEPPHAPRTRRRAAAAGETRPTEPLGDTSREEGGTPPPARR